MSNAFQPLAVVAWNNPTLQFMATGTIRLVSSANSALNLSKKGSLHVVPSGHIPQASMIPKGNQRSMSSAMDVVGRLASRPS
ncbi:hypothetical protein FRX31_032902 [Thalictrum thalictroides]|uniref:Uncharacterized protein n=1 Tax=Thalictrum thalictroides TaxID=46969 RepID=A0A7J6UYL3_THATH|nr:hypothetical protein FRX31_032902 [Thalictrum thalictroides]